MSSRSKVWGVYALVWAMPDGTKRVYVGGSTNIARRWHSYTRAFKLGQANRKFTELYQAAGMPSFHVLQKLEGTEHSVLHLADREWVWILKARDRIGTENVLNGKARPSPTDYGWAAAGESLAHARSGHLSVAGGGVAVGELGPAHSAPLPPDVQSSLADVGGSSRI